MQLLVLQAFIISYKNKIKQQQLPMHEYLFIVCFNDTNLINIYEYTIYLI